MIVRTALVGLAVVLTGCAGTELGKTKGLDAGGSAFTAALYDGYVDLSQGEFDEADFKDSDVFALRARAAAGGDIQAPEEISARELPADMQPQLASARAELVSALDAGGRQLMPNEAARAQVAFDCWMQEQEENFQPDDIAACQGDFEAALAALKGGLAPTPVAAAAPARPAPKQQPKVFTVLFDFDDSGLTTGAQSTLTEAIDFAKGIPGATIAVAGYTDSSGNSSYNDTLASTRAEVVAASLRGGGIASNDIRIASFGEDEPAVQTGDGVREVRNRRVQVVIIP